MNTTTINFKGTGGGTDAERGPEADAEGHGFRLPPADMDTDAEGHGYRGPEPGIDDDAEGHAAKAGRGTANSNQPGKPRVIRP